MVRLGVMWEAVETQPGVYDDAYLHRVDKLITRLGNAGIYTMIDAHQDVFAQRLCGEGIPNFYANQILEAGSFCIDASLDWMLTPLLKPWGVCKSINDYGLRLGKDGNPLVEDCQKHEFF